MKFNQKADLKKISLLLIILLIALSCREEIIQPDNFVENVNEPVQINERNSYIFLLNAQGLSMDLSVPAFFNSYRARFNVRLIDYENGYISIAVEDMNNNERFRYFLADNVSYHSDILDGYVLNTIKIRTVNFSGKIKVEFRKSL